MGGIHAEYIMIYLQT